MLGVKWEWWNLDFGGVGILVKYIVGVCIGNIDRIEGLRFFVDVIDFLLNFFFFMFLGYKKRIVISRIGIYVRGIVILLVCFLYYFIDVCVWE